MIMKNEGYFRVRSTKSNGKLRPVSDHEGL
jgi:predicted transcriptional regulator